ncbi:MAG: DUF4065 domain-containing protein [Syntrophobacterales bacterium]|jgi:uncharacterized phage-associated protein|nr:DUF4065 domain-containing protein [Syntrophobacterales bacterium]
MKKRYTALEIAKYFISKSGKRNGELLSNRKLQKMVSCAQGLYVNMYGEPLFEDEIEVWNDGPIIPTLYEALKEFGDDGIPPDHEFDPSLIEEDATRLLDEIHSVFSQYVGIRLMEALMTTDVGNKLVWVM